MPIQGWNEAGWKQSATLPKILEGCGREGFNYEVGRKAIWCGTYQGVF
jgi:hypothetical protein